MTKENIYNRTDSTQYLWWKRRVYEWLNILAKDISVSKQKEKVEPKSEPKI